MILAYYGQEFTEPELAALLGTDESGTRFRELAALATLGLDGEIRNGALPDLSECTHAGIPCIARVRTTHLPRYPLPPWVPHAVVVVAVSARRVFIHDPAQNNGPEAVPRQAFTDAWQAGQFQFAAFTPATRRQPDAEVPPE